MRPQSRGRTSVDSHSPVQSRIPIPNTTLFVDPGWYGKVVVETEGTNEALADLQDRCGPGVFPPRAGGRVPNMNIPNDKEKEEAKMVWRIMRERRFVFLNTDSYLSLNLGFVLVVQAKYGFELLTRKKS